MRTTVTIVAGLALLLAGCGADGDDGDGQGDTLQDYLGVGDADDPEAMQAEFEDRQRRTEEHIAECMAEEGFEYEPREPMTGDVATHPREELEPEEFAEEYGYGITTIEPDEQGMTEAPEDPNQERMQEMGEAERQAYQEALQGEMPEPDPDADPEEAVEFEIGGCRGEAREAVQGDQQRIQQELGDEMQELYERVESDPRIVEAKQGWAECMRGAGWEQFDQPEDTFTYISEQQNELMQQAQPDEPPEELQDLEPGEAPPEDFEFEPPEPDPEAMEELRAEEIELATDDHRCTVEHLGEERERYEEVRQDHEREFVEEHRETLEELGDG